jgi:hypothetical protein
MRRAWHLAIGLSPALIACAFVLSSYVVNAVPAWLLWRPLGLSLAVAIGIQIIAVAIGGWVRGTFWAFVLVSALAGMLVLAGASVLALTVFTLVRSTPGREYRLASSLAVAVSALLVSALAVQGVRNGAFDWEAPSSAIDLGAAQRGPSIHLLVLDGYPREDTMTELGFDNTPFLDALRERGFDVYSGSRSNYDRTAFTFVTMLSMRHLEEIDQLWVGGSDDPVEQTRVVSRTLQDLPLFSWLEELGYRTRVLQSSIAHVPLGDADVDDTVHTANNFELDLLQRTFLAGALESLGFARQQQRSHVVETLAAFADPPSDPTFTLAHVLSPHAPFVLDADGSLPPAPPCYPATCSLFENDIERLGWSKDEYWTRLTTQVDELNELVIEAVDDLVERDPDAVIVIFSDHGQRIPGDDEAMFRNLVVARTPGFRQLLGEAPTNINVLPSVFDAYLGTRIARLPDALFTSGDDPWLAVERFDDDR